MSTQDVAELADQLGMTTADRIEPPEPKPRKGRPPTKDWSMDKKRAFNGLAPAALCVVASDGPLSVTLHDWRGGPPTRYGDNRPIWPVRLARTGSWRDTVTITYDKFPLARVATQFRVWCLTEEDRDALADHVQRMLDRHTDEHGSTVVLEHGFVDAGSDWMLPQFEHDVHARAAEEGITTWDDDSMSRFIDTMLAEVTRRGGLGRGVNARSYDHVALELLGRG